jgi:uncharacterized membrane protein YeaQ/YmgE (transglycosylase-associated protein family)
MARHVARDNRDFRESSPFTPVLATGAIRKATAMSILAWIVLGLVAGFIASKIVNKSGEGVVLDIVLGIVGAVVGGFLFNAVGSGGVTGFNLWSILVAVIGAVVVLVVKHAVTGRGSARA